MDAITGPGLWALVKHLKQWLLNLRNAGAARKAESISALRAVIVAARQTSAYVRQLDETARQDHAEQPRLAVMWTALGFLLDDLERLAREMVGEIERR